MIRNRLAVLLAERGLKITRVAKDTGISRNTITAAAQNDSEMIRLETINTLCKYLSITPGEFFEYEPVDISFSLYINKLSLSADLDNDIFLKEANIDLFMDVNENNRSTSIDLHCQLINEVEISSIPFDDNIIPLQINFEIDKEKEQFIETIYNKISPAFHKDIYTNLTNILQIELTKKLEETAEESSILSSILEDPFIDENIFKNIQPEVQSDVFKQF